MNPFSTHLTPPCKTTWYSHEFHNSHSGPVVVRTYLSSKNDGVSQAGRQPHATTNYPSNYSGKRKLPEPVENETVGVKDSSPNLSDGLIQDEIYITLLKEHFRIEELMLINKVLLCKDTSLFNSLTKYKEDLLLKAIKLLLHPRFLSTTMNNSLCQLLAIFNQDSVISQLSLRAKNKFIFLITNYNTSTRTDAASHKPLLSLMEDIAEKLLISTLRDVTKIWNTDQLTTPEKQQLLIKIHSYCANFRINRNPYLNETLFTLLSNFCASGLFDQLTVKYKLLLLKSINVYLASNGSSFADVTTNKYTMFKQAIIKIWYEMEQLFAAYASQIKVVDPAVECFLFADLAMPSLLFNQESTSQLTDLLEIASEYLNMDYLPKSSLGNLQKIFNYLCIKKTFDMLIPDIQLKITQVVQKLNSCSAID
ncbi:MAG: hypothetical protein ACK4M7_02020 [Burkholderiales bacterium]